MSDEIKEKIKAYYVANDIDEILDYITNLQEEKEDYKSRCEKAIELLNKYRNRKDTYCLWCMEYGDNAEAIKVLGGEVINSE